MSRLPFIRALLRGTIVHDFQRLHSIYGPVLRVAPNEVTFADEAAWADIFQTHTDNGQFLKDPLWWGGQTGLPNSLLSAIDPEEHATMRKVFVPAFTPRALRAQEPIIHQYVNLLVERLQELVAAAEEDGEKAADIDMVPWFHFTAFDIFGDLGFGESFNCLQSSKYHPWIALLFNSVKAASFVAAVRYYPWLQSLLFKCIPKSLREMQTDHYQQIVEKVDRRLNWELERPDIMSHVIDERKGAAALPTDVIYVTFMILTTAGSETTATVLSGAMNYLVSNPEKMDILKSEIRDKFQSEAEISLETLRQLPYLNAVLSEALRLCPPVPWVLPRRVPASGGEVAGVWLPGGVSSTQLMHRAAQADFPQRLLFPSKPTP
ncbi:hypothetical protein KVR01_013318 [Diaporthe batatas]|uniref:uncharacterized protein n=1 Tax=Diaporthe batatas TaxID=748121 RepID=UPI001D0598EE|nr:uncharacterized protein KVR01_013318 [Diaporthe batatas]KAG8156905.1 hypothetical protein KVR01_013318 [Diaporthe batatas]